MINTVIFYEQIYNDVLDEAWSEDNNSIQCQISRLRKKPNQLNLIHSFHDVGYYLEKQDIELYLKREISI